MSIGAVTRKTMRKIQVHATAIPSFSDMALWPSLSIRDAQGGGGWLRGAIGGTVGFPMPHCGILETFLLNPLNHSKFWGIYAVRTVRIHDWQVWRAIGMHCSILELVRGFHCFMCSITAWFKQHCWAHMWEAKQLQKWFSAKGLVSCPRCILEFNRSLPILKAPRVFSNKQESCNGHSEPRTQDVIPAQGWQEVTIASNVCNKCIIIQNYN